MKSPSLPLKQALIWLLAPALALVLAAPVAAQYPPPVGAVVPTASTVTAAPGDAVTLSVTVLDPAGNPQPGVTGTFTIVESPVVRAWEQERFVMASVPTQYVQARARDTWNTGGSVAAYQTDQRPFLDPTTATTNANGVASTTLHVGTTPGRIVVEANFGGEVARMTVIVSGAADGVTELPVTGVGPANASGLDGSTTSVIGAGLLTVGALLAWGFRRWIRAARAR